MTSIGKQLSSTSLQPPMSVRAPLSVLQALHWLSPVLRDWVPQKFITSVQPLLRQEQPPHDGPIFRPYAQPLDETVHAIETAVSWCARPSTKVFSPDAEGADPWTRDRALMRFQQQAAEHPPLALEHEGNLYRAFMSGDWSLALLLAEHTRQPPHVFHFIYQQKGSEARAAALFECPEDATRAAVLAWGGTGPLPVPLRLALRQRYQAPKAQQESLPAFCDALGLPADLDTAFRIAALQAVWEPTDTAGARTRSEAFTCVACKAAVTECTHLTGCNCAPALCDGCAASTISGTEDRLTCPTECGAPINREYLERIGVAPSVARARLLTALSSKGVPERFLRRSKTSPKGR